MGSAVARLQVSGSRFDLLLTFWCLPVTLLRDAARRVSQHLFRPPLVGLLWKGRFLLGVTVLISSHLDGTLPIGVVGAVFIALSYLLPWVREAREHHVDRLARAVLLHSFARTPAGRRAVLGIKPLQPRSD